VLSIPLSLNSCDYVTLVVTLLSGQYAMISRVSNKGSVSVIHVKAERVRELLQFISFVMTTSNSGTLL
jgi:hypothetical protein